MTDEHTGHNEKASKEMVSLAKSYTSWVKDNTGKQADEKALATAGKLNPKRRLAEEITDTMASNIVQNIGTAVNTVVF